MSDKRMLLRAESDCYRIAYYLLESEDAAVQAARLALGELLRDEAFGLLPEEARRQQTKRAAIHYALEVKRRLIGGYADNRAI